MWTTVLKGECPEIPVNGTTNSTIVDPFTNATTPIRKPVYIVRKNKISLNYPVSAASYGAASAPYANSKYPGAPAAAAYGSEIVANYPGKSYASSSTYVSDGSTYVKKSETVYGTGYDNKPVVASAYSSLPIAKKPSSVYTPQYIKPVASSSYGALPLVKKSEVVYGKGYNKPVVATASYGPVSPINYGAYDNADSYVDSLYSSFT